MKAETLTGGAAMTATARPGAATLLRAGLAVMVLAIIAGIFGMHVMTGNHGSHTNQASAVSVRNEAAGHEADGHETHGHSNGGDSTSGPETGTNPDHSVAAAPVLDNSCKGSCHSMQESGAACIPSAKAGSLTVFPPHKTGVSFNAGMDTLSGPAAAYAFTPSGPTPGELSISRT
jgi:hypothetical protein